MVQSVKIRETSGCVCLGQDEIGPINGQVSKLEGLEYLDGRPFASGFLWGKAGMLDKKNGVSWRGGCLSLVWQPARIHCC